ncbi:MAG: choice-of-anchor D domain-containing protein, partial [Wenzhouxiangellaceae bacterium]
MTRFLYPIIGCTLAVFSLSSKAATFGVESLDIIVGTSEVTVGWYFENSPENVGDLFVDVSFDDTLLTPRTTVQEIIPGTGIFVDVPDGCLDGVSGVADIACVLIAPDAIRISLSSTPQVIPSQDTGSLTFDLAPSLSDGDSVTLDLTLADLLPADADVTLIDGVLNFNDAPPGVLDVSPSDMDFGSVFLGQTSDSLPVSICNTGGVDALDITVSSVDIVPAEFGQGAGGNCDAEPFGLASGECCTYTVRFSPAAEGPVSGSMTVSISSGDIDSDSVILSGLGVAPPTELVVVESPDYAVIDGPFFGGVVVHV